MTQLDAPGESMHGESIQQHEWLQHEANGDPELLEALAQREEIIDQLAEDRDTDSPLWPRLYATLEKINQLKGHDVSPPPGISGETDK